MSLLYVGFNQSDECFACGTETGFIVYNCDPLKERFQRDLNGGIGIVEMFYKTNVLALVGGGQTPKFPPHKVMFWDDFTNSCFAELDLHTEVKAVRLKRDRVVVAVETKVYVYSFPEFHLTHCADTAPNPTGILSLLPTENRTIFACPGTVLGTTHIDCSDKVPIDIATNTSKLACVTMNKEGTLLATTDDWGRVIQIFEIATGKKLKEFQRGTTSAEISCLKFSDDSNLLLVSSGSETIHFFQVQDPITDQNVGAYFPAYLMSYVSSERSVLKHKIPPGRKYCTFGRKNSMIAVHEDGTYYNITYNMASLQTSTNVITKIGEITVE